MKQLNIALLALLGIFMFASCETEDVGPKLANYKPADLTSLSAVYYNLTEETMNDTMDTLMWAPVDYGFQSAATYTIQVDVKGNNFQDPAVVAEVTEQEYIIIVGDFNNVLLGMDLAPDVDASVEMRVLSSIHDSVEVLASNIIDFDVNPFLMEIVYKRLYVPGSYQGWDVENIATTLTSEDDNGKYEGYIYFPDPNAEFKFADGPSWDVNWGDNGADGTLDPGGANIAMPISGYYKLNVDLNSLTYSSMRTDWGLIGSATGSWDADQDMVYDAALDKWTITLDLVVGEIKFRANDDWGLNYGDGSDSEDPDGRLDAGGSNIAITEAGNYTVILDLSDCPIYTYSVVKN